MKILCLLDSYLPGYKAGGPLRTVVNMVDRLGYDLQFKIVTRDHDSGDTEPYAGVTINDWNIVGKADVFYMSPERISVGGLKKILHSTEYDVVYLNSFFSPRFTITPLLLRRFHLIPDKSLVIAPRGEFSAGALRLKKLKKRAYILAAKALNLCRGAVWQASSMHEEADIRRVLGENVKVVIAPDLAPFPSASEKLPSKSEKRRGLLRIVFLSRICPKKNLIGALKILRGLQGKIEFDIYGPLEDKKYWAKCQNIINKLPKNIDVRFCDKIAHEQVAKAIRKYDLFLFPTLGENFGHVILEALCAGLPVLLSDQTPWRELEEKGVGWDVPLENIDRFKDILQRCLDMENSEYLQWSERARKYGLHVSQDNKTVESNRKLFLKSLKQKENNI